MSDVRLSIAMIESLSTMIMAALGTPADLAAVVGSSLASANACGHDSHGLLRLPWYAGFVTDGRARPERRARVERRSAGTAAIDGRAGWGQPAAHLAVQVASELAAKHGTATVTIRRCNHIGRLGEYAEALAERGLVSLLWCNADPAMAPHGGSARLLGTNPFAAGIPNSGRPPVIVDFATAGVAEGKLRLVHQAGGDVPPGLIQDAQGHPSTDPEDFYSGGALLPFGAHKGYGLAVMIEFLGGALSGNHIAMLPEYAWGNGTVIMAIDPGRFSAGAFDDEIDRASSVMRRSRPAPGVDHVLLPGDIERATRDRRQHEGVLVPDGVWRDIVGLADRLSVPLPG